MEKIWTYKVDKQGYNGRHNTKTLMDVTGVLMAYCDIVCIGVDHGMVTH